MKQLTESALDAPAVRRAQILRIQPDRDRYRCDFQDEPPLFVRRSLAGFLEAGDAMEYPLLAEYEATPEMRILKNKSHRGAPELYQAEIGFVTPPMQDHRKEHFHWAGVVNSGLGIGKIYLPSARVRDHFYSADRRGDWDNGPNFYDLLGAPSTATLGDLRLAYRLRRLETEHPNAPRDERLRIERAFNILGNPNLRAVYDDLLRDPDTPVIFPYGGFGYILVAGRLSPDGETFFTTRILEFLPDRRRRKFRAPLHRMYFLPGHAIYRNGQQKVDVIFDPVALPIDFDPGWNRWKRLLGVNIDVEGTFAKSGKVSLQSGQLRLVSWDTALPSSLEVSVPPHCRKAIEAARRTYQRFGEHTRELEQLRALIQERPVERREIERLCSELAIPGDLDVAQITWEPDYNSFFYRQLADRARSTYLFRSEYIFELEHGAVVEVPKLGHATYVFAKPDDISTFVADYAKTTKTDIRKNRGNIADRLGFVGRVQHAGDQKRWWGEVRVKMGELDHWSEVEV